MGAGFGKTTFAINELLFEALLHEKGLYWYVAPTYRQAKSIAWRMLLDAYYKLPKELQINKNEAELWVEVGNGSRIELKGADNEDSLRGSGIWGIVIDEVASIKNWNELWLEVLRPALTDKAGWGIFISTPKGFNHFWDLFQAEAKDKDFKSFHYTSYDNPFIVKEEIDKAKIELTEDAFAQEYLADFKKHTGLVYKDFDRKLHVIEPVTIPEFWQHYGAMDFGAVNPTVHLWIAVDNNDTIYVVDEYYAVGQTKGHADFILAKTKVMRYNILTTWCDPSGEQEQLDYASFGLYATPAVKVFDGHGQSWVNYGIGKVSELLKPNPQTGRPRIYIFKNCVNLIREFESYRWKDFREGLNAVEVPEKSDDHGPDALRYFVVSNENKNYRQYEEHLPLKTNPYSGYRRL